VFAAASVAAWPCVTHHCRVVICCCRAIGVLSFVVSVVAGGVCMLPTLLPTAVVGCLSVSPLGAGTPFVGGRWATGVVPTHTILYEPKDQPPERKNKPHALCTLPLTALSLLVNAVPMGTDGARGW